MSNILGLWDDDNLKRIERDQRQSQRDVRHAIKRQERLDHEAGFAAGGPVDESASWEYRAGQQAREETDDDETPADYRLHEELYIVDEYIPWWKKIF